MVSELRREVGVKKYGKYPYKLAPIVYKSRDTFWTKGGVREQKKSQNLVDVIHGRALTKHVTAASGTTAAVGGVKFSSRFSQPA